ncbi:hypothetical protein AB46_2134 [Escherichia coli 3-267-03_S1_C2]|uniref:DUF805 domain-containing protein n=1 Tax=Escherichia coli TaxID=562 RepID=UPI0004D3B093|nr:DUF805 domain-containing protein [Escherichia coli]KDU03984.1 hypothetical protein AB46_2134 [Escherichia coli 3-267-03_S1_C2]
MTYGDAYLAGWKNIFNYNGVATRFEFWSFIIGSAIICLLPLLSWLFAITIDDDYGAFIFFALPTSFILTLIFAVPGMALGFRRMHDIGRSGWWFAIGVLIPYAGVILFILCCLPPKPQEQA